MKRSTFANHGKIKQLQTSTVRHLKTNNKEPGMDILFHIEKKIMLWNCLFTECKNISSVKFIIVTFNCVLYTYRQGYML